MNKCKFSAEGYQCGQDRAEGSDYCKWHRHMKRDEREQEIIAEEDTAFREREPLTAMVMDWERAIKSSWQWLNAFRTIRRWEYWMMGIGSGISASALTTFIHWLGS